MVTSNISDNLSENQKIYINLTDFGIPFGFMLSVIKLSLAITIIIINLIYF